MWWAVLGLNQWPLPCQNSGPGDLRLAAACRLAEVRAGPLVRSPGTSAGLAVPVVKAARVRVLARGVPREIRMPKLKLAQGETAETAELRFSRESDLVQQADVA